MCKMRKMRKKIIFNMNMKYEFKQIINKSSFAKFISFLKMEN